MNTLKNNTTKYMQIYSSPVGNLRITADDLGVTGVSFCCENAIEQAREMLHEEANSHIVLTILWLDIYFAGKLPSFVPPLHVIGSDFQLQVWQKLMHIPYAVTTTYGEIAREIAAERGIPRMSAQAVGHAVGSNPIAIILPCHRVLAARSIGGYAYGVEAKEYLLRLEKVKVKN